MKLGKEQVLIGILRIFMGWIFLWPFLDKLLGLGISTPAEQAWLAGGSPTWYFLSKMTAGPLAGFFQSLAGLPVVDALFMVGICLIGLALLLGIGVRVAGYSGAFLLILMWSAHLPPEQNPLIDEHVVYALMMIFFTQVKAGSYLGLGKYWANTELVKKFPILE